MDIFDHRLARLMHSASETEPFDSEEHIYELKLEGIRCLAYLDGSRSLLFTRRNREIVAQFPELAAIHRQTRGRCILDGTVVVGSGTKSDLAVAKRRALGKSPHIIKRLAEEHPCTFVAQDILYHKRAPLTTLPLAHRHDLLGQVIRESSLLCSTRTVEGSGILFSSLVRERGLEGVIAKRKTSLYHMGKSTRDWLAFRAYLQEDFVICGFSRDHAAHGSLSLGQYGGDGTLRYKGCVVVNSAGKTFALIARQPRLPSPPFSNHLMESERDMTWIVPRLVCQVRFPARDEDGNLRQPVFDQLCLNKLPYAARDLEQSA